jgi:hypothetical protein
VSGGKRRGVSPGPFDRRRPSQHGAAKHWAPGPSETGEKVLSRPVARAGNPPPKWGERLDGGHA